MDKRKKLGDATICRVCNSNTVTICTVLGVYSNRQYSINYCTTCHLSFVVDPESEYEKIYSADYYSGMGADPLINYLYELDHPDETIRLYEWAGIAKIINELIPLSSKTRWLDFGCGNGGLVRFIHNQYKCQIIGYDKGWIIQKAVEKGIPILDEHELERLVKEFDIITAIEVLEHLVDPMSSIRSIRAMLKENGLFFYTTGNAKPHRNHFLRWAYVVPEVHVSFYEPETLEYILTHAGFKTEYPGYLSGYTEIIRYKILKTLKIKKMNPYEKALPWQIITRIVDANYQVTAFPVGWG
jgi:SAM-dependent methyltransferase